MRLRKLILKSSIFLFKCVKVLFNLFHLFKALVLFNALLKRLAQRLDNNWLRNENHFLNQVQVLHQLVTVDLELIHLYAHVIIRPQTLANFQKHLHNINLESCRSLVFLVKATLFNCFNGLEGFFEFNGVLHCTRNCLQLSPIRRFLELFEEICTTFYYVSVYFLSFQFGPRFLIQIYCTSDIVVIQTF